VKFSSEEVKFSPTVMDIFPVEAPCGTVTVSDVVVTSVTTVVVPLNLTTFFSTVGLKLVPEITTTVPAVPLTGETL
jgi:hypothetical protein